MRRLMLGFLALVVTVAASGAAAREIDGPNAAAGPCTRPLQDDDGDGLPNKWECQPVTFPKGVLDLPAMGASPRHKDIFVECDFMRRPGKNLRPTQAALAMVGEAFANAPVTNPDGVTGIKIHVDAGSVAVNVPNRPRLRKGNAIPYVEDWSDDPFASGQFDAAKRQNFDAVRKHAFHYCVFANNYAENYSSGLARGIPADDFIVTLGGAGWGPYPRSELTQQQAGTLMHELGHTLGLTHGGTDHVNYKPNYLSIMNYAFQLNGLIYDGTTGPIDYSRFKAGNLDERSLREPAGIGGPPAIRRYGTIWSCPNQVLNVYMGIAETNVRNGVDWDCNGAVAGVVSQSINDPDFFTDYGYKSVLDSQDNWENLVFNGGSIGTGTRVVQIMSAGEIEELGPAEAARVSEALRRAGLLR